MTRKEKLLQRQNVLYRQIDVMILFEIDFLQSLSKKELHRKIDAVLDELIQIREQLKKIDNDNSTI